MTERFNVGGAMLLKLFGHRETEDACFAEKAANVRDLGVRIAVLTRMFFAAMTLVPSLATALVYGVGGYLAVNGQPLGRHPDRPGHLAAATARPAPGALQRPRRRDDRAGQLRPRLRGARPAVARSRRSPTPSPCRATAASLEFEDVSFSYPRADEISLASLESVARTESRDSGEVLHDLVVRRRARADGRPGRPVRGRQDHGHPPGRPAVRRDLRRRPRRRPATSAT